MTASNRFKCPVCGFAVFNRRVAVCEACKAPLPAAMKFSEVELTRLQEEAARNGKVRADLAREAEALEEKKRRRRGDGG